MNTGPHSIPDALRLAARHLQAGQANLAESVYRQIIKAAPYTLDARRDLAALFLMQHRYLEAERLLILTLKRAPDDKQTLLHLGMTLINLGKYTVAEPVLRRLLELQPSHPEAPGNLGMTLYAQGRYPEAETFLKLAIQRQPGDSSAGCNLVSALLKQGRAADALAVARAQVKIFPDIPRVYSALLYTLTCDEHCSPENYLEEARRFGACVAAKAKPFLSWPCVTDTDSGDFVLRVGFVSGDLRHHPVGHFLENFIAHMNRSRVQLFAYRSHVREDELSERLQTQFAGWHDITWLSDEAAAAKIRGDGIHVLVDLSGHTTHNRLPLFAWKPAPVQATWLGYSASSGVAAMDWLIADEITVPAAETRLYSEKPWYLPHTRVCFTPPPEAADLPVAALPALKNGFTTFGTFQSLAKISDGSMALWGRVLTAIPTARLRVQNSEMASPENRAALLGRLNKAGISADRVITATQMPRADYLAAHAEVDVILDTFPYPGGTTTCEAMWMGVPTLTLPGRTLLSRYGASVLSACGLQAWVATDANDFVQRAVRLTADTDSLATLRAGLREQARGSPLFDGAAFARNLTDAFYGMWNARG